MSSPPLQEQNLSPGTSDHWDKTFDALQDAVTILSPDLLVIKANKAAYDTFGLVYGELIGKPCYQVFHGQKEPCPTCPVSQPNLNKNVETAT
ncbi:MAG: PAS domain-containing protein, partial [Desulfopila sp.]|nr:PAS domain-containing protein [Desulfopila sp.]